MPTFFYFIAAFVFLVISFAVYMAFIPKEVDKKYGKYICSSILIASLLLFAYGLPSPFKSFDETHVGKHEIVAKYKIYYDENYFYHFINRDGYIVNLEEFFGSKIPESATFVNGIKYNWWNRNKSVYYGSYTYLAIPDFVPANNRLPPTTVER